MIYSEKGAQDLDLNPKLLMNPWGALDWLLVTSVKIVVKCLNQSEEGNCTIFTYYNATQIRKKQLSLYLDDIFCKPVQTWPPIFKV